ncbi:unnamed protein product, partial [Prorocentrum cordatum]
RTLEMSAVERLIPGKDPAVLLRMPEDTFRAVARSLAPRVSSRLLAAACVMQARVEGAQLAPGGYLESVAASVTNGGPLPQAPVRWPLEEVLQSMDLLARAANADPEQPLLRLELACSWEESGLRSFGPAGAAAVVRLGYLQARQALHAFAGGRVAKERWPPPSRSAWSPPPGSTPAPRRPTLPAPAPPAREAACRRHG